MRRGVRRHGLLAPVQGREQAPRCQVPADQTLDFSAVCEIRHLSTNSDHPSTASRVAPLDGAPSGRLRLRWTLTGGNYEPSCENAANSVRRWILTVDWPIR